MFSQNKKIILLLACLVLAACGSAPEKKSALSAQAIRQSERGTAAFAQGDYARALHEYGLALRANLAIENAAGIAIERINLARAWREMSQDDQAHFQLNALFVPPVLPYPEASLAAAATMQAQLYLENSAAGAAVPWVDRGEALCQRKCPVAASLLLLRAQLAMHEQRFADARKLVDDAAGLLNTPQQAVELANALRLSGEIYFAVHDDDRAIARFEAALARDQKLGLPGKVRLDLLRLAQAAEHAGRKADARNYADRAQSVNRAMGEEPDVSALPAAVPPVPKAH